MRDDFAVFILTHGRPDNVITLNSLKQSGYTGRWFLIIDNEDTTGDKYRELHGKENVIVFSKKAMDKTFDIGDSIDERGCVTYARNASFQIAKDLGLKHFVQLDDDYTDFLHRYDDNGKLGSVSVTNMDAVVDAMLEFLTTSNAKTVAFSQGGDFIGGAQSGNWKTGLLRKAMNSFFVTTDDPFTFVGRINEDVNTYVTLGTKGQLFLTPNQVMLVQVTTQKNKGGLTEIYLALGTYVKSFYTVMMQPSSVKISVMGDTHYRFHHFIKWNNTVPKIINERHKRKK